MHAQQYLVTLSVAQCWIDDGYDPNNLQDIQRFMHDALERRLPFADGTFELSTMIEPALSNKLTCVYCGHEFPAGTPASGSDVAVLTKHINHECAKHPMRLLEKHIGHLKAALEERGATPAELSKIFNED